MFRRPDPDAVSVRAESGVALDAELEHSDTTAVVPRRGALSAALRRAESLHAWGFVAVATFAFCVVYVAMYRFAPRDTAKIDAGAHSRSRTAAVVPPAMRSGPVIVPTEASGTAANRAGPAVEPPEAEHSGGAGDPRGRAARSVRVREPAVRGDVLVEPGALYFAVPLERPEPDARFGVQVTPSWPTTLAIVGKTATGFIVSFGTPAPDGARFDWSLVR